MCMCMYPETPAPTPTLRPLTLHARPSSRAAQVHQKQIYEYNEAKKKFIGEPFRTHFGKASSIPLRPEGVVGSDGKYPKQPTGMVAPLAVDWNMFVEQGEPRKGGPKWK